MSTLKIGHDWRVDVDFDKDDDPQVHGWIEHIPSGLTASLGAMEMTGLVDDGWDEKSMEVPEKVQYKALKFENKVLNDNQ